MNLKEESPTIIKKSWLKATIWLFVFYPVVTTIAALSLFFLSKPMIMYAPSTCLFSLFGSLLFFWLLWRFTYKKPGTDFLTFLLILGPIGSIYSIYLFFQHMSQISYDENIFFIGNALGNLFLYIRWYRCSLRIRKINKDEQKLIYTLAYVEAKEAVNLKEISKIKKHWYLATMSYFLVIPIVASLAVLFLIFSNNNAIGGDRGFIIGYNIGLALPKIVMGLFLWFCAYRKPGTKLLILLLFTSPINLFTSMSMEFAWARQMNVGLSVSILYVATALILYVYWYIFSLKLRKVNKILQIEKAIPSDFLRSIHSMILSEAIDDLNVKFSALNSHWPSLSHISLQMYESSLSKLSLKEGVLLER